MVTKIKSYKRVLTAEQRAKHCENSRRYYYRHLDMCRKKGLDKYYRNKERYLAYQKDYYYACKKLRQKQMKKWFQENRRDLKNKIFENEANDILTNE